MEVKNFNQRGHEKTVLTFDKTDVEEIFETIVEAVHPDILNQVDKEGETILFKIIKNQSVKPHIYDDFKTKLLIKHGATINPFITCPPKP